MNRPVSLSLLASRNFPIENNLFEAPAYASFQQLLQRLINLSPCENKVFVVEVSFSDIHDDTHAISVCSALQSQCEAHGSLRTVAKQFSVNAKDLCDISFVST